MYCIVSYFFSSDNAYFELQSTILSDCSRMNIAQFRDSVQVHSTPREKVVYGNATILNFKDSLLKCLPGRRGMQRQKESLGIYSV